MYIIPKPDYRSMLEDKKMIEAITKNVALLYPVGIKLSLSDKYKMFYFYVEKFFQLDKWRFLICLLFNLNIPIMFIVDGMNKWIMLYG